MSFDAPQSRNEAILQNILGAENVLVPAQSEIEAILLAILNDTSYSLEGRSRIARLLIAIKNNGTWDELPCISKNEEILYCILNGEAYQGETYSRNEELLKQWSESHATYEKTVSGNPIHVTDAVEETALALSVAFEPTQAGTPFVGDTTYEPYLSKTASTTGNKRYLDKIVGGTVAWNQLAELDSSIWGLRNTTITFNQNNGFDIKSSSSSSVYRGVSISKASGVIQQNHVFFISATAYTSYDDGIVRLGIKNDTTHFNYDDFLVTVNATGTTPKLLQCIGKTSSSYPYVSIGIRTNQPTSETAYVEDLQVVDLTLMFANAPAIADYVYSLEQAEAGAGVQWLKNYDFIDDTYRSYSAGELISTRPEGIQYGNTTYAFGSPVELRGLYRLDANNKLYCDGDELTPDGVLTANYDYRAYQSGDEELTDAITDGTNTIVKKVTPTTASSETYPNAVTIENGDTESFIDTRSIPLPVGNNSHYAGEYAVQGKTGLTVNHAQTQEDTPTTYSVTFTEQGTVYGGVIDIVTGALSITWGYIASYNGETLTGRWMSSLDVYAEGTTPTTGAEVAYELASPITAELTPQQVDMLLGENTVWTDDASDSISLTYIGTNPAVQLLAGLRKNSNNAKMVKLLKGGLKDAEIIRK